MSDTKTCPGCLVEKSRTEFHNDRARRDGLDVHCRACKRIRKKARAEQLKAIPIESRILPERKTCSKCRTQKPAIEFYIEITRRDGLSCWCRVCTNEQSMRRKTKKRETFNPAIVPESKVCIRCSVEYAAQEFYITKSAYDGLSTYCRKCTCEASYSSIRESKADDAVAFKVRAMLNSIRSRAKKLGHTFDLDQEFLHSIMTDVCPVLGIPLDFNQTQISSASPSVDKFYPHLGYIKGNVRIISFKANAMKQDATTDEIMKLAEWMQKTEIEVNQDLNLSKDNVIRIAA